jgi:succinoglycan biosynthesis protein ExoM
VSWLFIGIFNRGVEGDLASKKNEEALILSSFFRAGCCMTNSTTRIIVAICTFNRNEELTRLLEALLVSAAQVSERADVGVVIVDDSSDRKARKVAKRFEGKFDLELLYRVSGHQNISLARNLAIETACEIGDWTAMIDDDCEPNPEWLSALLDIQRRFRADAVTGTMIRRVPPGSPKWLTEEPFLELGLDRSQDGAKISVASTFNSMISSRWLREHPTVRFDPDLGVTGGEDMVFYRHAHSTGLRIHYAARAIVYENEPASRTTLTYQLQCFFWHGNSSYVTSIRDGIHPLRMILHGIGSLGRALLRPIGRMCRGQRPQLRYCLASVLHALGKLIGPFGVRIRHG